MDPLIPITFDDDEEEEAVTAAALDFDSEGRSSVARLADAALALFRADRSLTFDASLLWLVLASSTLAQDALWSTTSSMRARGMFSTSTTTDYLNSVIREAEGALSYALAKVDDVPVDWHKRTVQLLKSGEAPQASDDFLQNLLVNLGQWTTNMQDDVTARIFRHVLARHLRQSDAGLAEGEVWLNFAMSVSEKRKSSYQIHWLMIEPYIALAVIHAIKPVMMDSKPFEVAQNRLANALTAVSAKNANEKGIPALRILIASAPALDAASEFIPQQRAIFVLRHIATWLAAGAGGNEDEEDEDEDEGEEMLIRVAELYIVLAPIVQSVPGAHWESIFDLLENVLDEVSSCSP